MIVYHVIEAGGNRVMLDYEPFEQTNMHRSYTQFLLSPAMNEFIKCRVLYRLYVLGSGLPWQVRFVPCLDFGFQYALIRNNWSKKFGVEYWTLPGSNSPWRPGN